MADDPPKTKPKPPGRPGVTYREYDDEFRAQVLARYAEVGGGQTARDFGIPVGTVSTWASRARVKAPSGQQQAAAAREACRRTLDHLALRCAEVAETFLEDAEAESSASNRRHLAHSAALLLEKAQLLSGGVTARTVSEDPEVVRAEALRLRDELAERRRERVPDDLPAVAGEFVAPDF